MNVTPEFISGSDIACRSSTAINGTNNPISCWNPCRIGHKLTILGLFFIAILASAVSQAQDATVDLSTTITGNREQPKVLYIVPWKAVNDSELEEQTIQSQLDIVFGHVERIELQRELQFIEQVEKTAEQEAE